MSAPTPYFYSRAATLPALSASGTQAGRHLTLLAFPMLSLLVVVIIHPHSAVPAWMATPLMGLYGLCAALVVAHAYAERRARNSPHHAAIWSSFGLLLAQVLADADRLGPGETATYTPRSRVLSIPRHGMSWPHILTDEPEERALVYTAFAQAVRAHEPSRWARWGLYKALLTIQDARQITCTAPSAHQRLQARALLRPAP